MSTPAEQSGGVEGVAAARLGVRSAGYCVFCDRIVERGVDDGCPAGHPAEGVAGRIVLVDGEPVPALPRFNLAAFLLPMVWGPAHGQWAGAVFLPLWLFADSTIRTAGYNAATGVAAVVVGLGTLAAMAWFAKRANGVAWRRVSDRVSVEEFARTQRKWAIASAPIAALLLGAALYFDLVILPAQGV